MKLQKSYIQTLFLQEKNKPKSLVTHSWCTLLLFEKLIRRIYKQLNTLERTITMVTFKDKDKSIDAQALANEAFSAACNRIVNKVDKLLLAHKLGEILSEEFTVELLKQIDTSFNDVARTMLNAVLENKDGFTNEDHDLALKIATLLLLTKKPMHKITMDIFDELIAYWNHTGCTVNGLLKVSRPS